MRRFALFLLVSAAALGGVYQFYPDQFARYLPDFLARQAARIPGIQRTPRTAEIEVIPVLAVPVVVRDVPVYRDGIGNVQAYAAITVRAQVDGRLLSVEFREGQDVRKGDVLARIDPAIYQAQLDQARAKKAQDEANLANMRIDLDRYERLASTNAGSKQQADGQRAMVAQMEAQVRADQATVDSARVYLDYTTVRAPIDGKTGLRLVDAGNIIRSSDLAGLVTIAQVTPISVLFTLPQRDFGPVRDAMAAGVVAVEALQADGGIVLARGTLEVVDNLIDTSTGTFKLKAAFANTDLRLWPGQFVTAHVEIAVLPKARVIPLPALRRGPEGTFVYIIENGKAQVRPVKVLLQDDEVAVISAGVEPDQIVVTTGFGRLADGKPVSLPGKATPLPAGPPGGPRS